MAVILSISSRVARGYVGNSVAAFALQRLGHRVIELPTIILSNHPGYAHVAGQAIGPDVLAAMFNALALNNWLGEIDAIATGYLPSVAHVTFALDAVRRVKASNPASLFYCDPVLGDDPGGVYIDRDAAAALRDQLVPQADVVFPNRFELAWLTGCEIGNLDDTVGAARNLGRPSIVVTSVPCRETWLATAHITRATVDVVRVERRAPVPKGTGDFLAALFIARNILGGDRTAHMASAVAGVDRVLRAGDAAGELDVIGTQELWVDPMTLETDDRCWEHRPR